MSKNTPLTISVPEAGKRYLGLGRNAAYAAAKSGQLPTIKIGKKLLRVPVRAMERMVDDLGNEATVRAMERILDDLGSKAAMRAMERTLGAAGTKAA